MRTRILDQMTEQEVRDYLNKNDIILLPVGTVEMHGEMPLACEHVMPLAFADRIAKEVDGLVLSGLVYFYPGATLQGKGSINISPLVSIAYLKEVFRSLWANGFRRIVCLTDHGPAYVFVDGAIREFFQETHNSIAYIDLNKQFDRVRQNNPEGADFNKMIWGSYYQLGRLDEIKKDAKPIKKAAPPVELHKLHAHAVSYGYAYSDISHHGWWPDRVMTEADRIKRAKEGVAQMDAVLKQLNAKAVVKAMADVNSYLEKKAKKTLPPLQHSL